MSEDTLLFIGLDTHKDSTEVAYVDDARGLSCSHFGQIKATKAGLVKLAHQLASKYPGDSLLSSLLSTRQINGDCLQ